MTLLKLVQYGLFICLLLGLDQVAYGELGLSIEAVVDGRISEATRRSNANWQGDIDLQIGQILRVRTVMRNNGLTESTPIISTLRPEAGVHKYVLVDSSGSETLLGRGRWHRNYSAGPRALLPGEEIVFETWFFSEIVETHNNGKPGSEIVYIFPKPGTYHIYSRYLLNALDKRSSNSSGISPQYIKSNKLSVRVSEAVPGWDDLKTAGILNTVRLSLYGNLDAQVVHSLEPLIRTSGDESMLQWMEEKAESRTP